MTTFDSFLDVFTSIGDEMLQLQNSDALQVQMKVDGSPVSSADVRSHQQLMQAFDRLGDGLPVISEEGPLASRGLRETWSSYWVVDPLDGTREYIAGGDEFAICVARVQNRQPDIGMIYSPAKRLGYFVGPDQQVKMWDDGLWSRLEAPEFKADDPYVVVSNFSYAKPKLKRFLEVLAQSAWTEKSIEMKSRSSALKFGDLACGRANLYPKLGPIMQWDIAAGYAILKALDLPFCNLDGQAIEFLPEQLKQIGFFAGDYQDAFQTCLGTLPRA